jgi:hypothetical protein
LRGAGVLRRSILSRTTTTTVLTISLPFQYVSTPPHPPPLPTLLQQLLFLRDATSTSLFIALPPLNPAQLRVPRQDEANDQLFVRPSIDAFEGEPGFSPDLHLLHLHPTLLNPRWPDDSMRTLTLNLPPLNPIASCDSRQDVDGVCSDLTRPLHHKSKSARKREMRQAMKQADKQRSESAPDLFLDRLQDDLVLGGTFLVADAFAIYRRTTRRAALGPWPVTAHSHPPARMSHDSCTRPHVHPVSLQALRGSWHETRTATWKRSRGTRLHRLRFSKRLSSFSPA